MSAVSFGLDRLVVLFWEELNDDFLQLGESWKIAEMRKRTRRNT